MDAPVIPGYSFEIHSVEGKYLSVPLPAGPGMIPWGKREEPAGNESVAVVYFAATQ